MSIPNPFATSNPFAYSPIDLITGKPAPAVPMISICFDGAIGLTAMAAGGLLMVGGLAVLIAFALKGSGIGQTAAGMLPGPVGAVARSQPKPEKVAAPAGPTPAQASEQRMTTARARVRTPEAEEAVTEARAGRGKRLTPAVSKELREAS
jgi:hypothetical protein